MFFWDYFSSPCTYPEDFNKLVKNDNLSDGWDPIILHSRNKIPKAAISKKGSKRRCLLSKVYKYDLGVGCPYVSGNDTLDFRIFFKWVGSTTT